MPTALPRIKLTGRAVLDTPRGTGSSFSASVVTRCCRRKPAAHSMGSKIACATAVSRGIWSGTVRAAWCILALFILQQGNRFKRLLRLPRLCNDSVPLTRKVTKVIARRRSIVVTTIRVYRQCVFWRSAGPLRKYVPRIRP